MSILIGNIPLKSRVIMAPMSGITDFSYRKLVIEFGGVGLTFSEMVASRAMIAQSRQSMLKSTIMHDDITGSCVQIAGCEAKVIAEAAKMNEDMGAKIIDLNFGCPAKKVVGGFAGSALMRDIKTAADIIEATVNAVKIPVTLKMRMGWDHDSLNAPEIAALAEKLGVKLITVHGRTRCQFYTGISDWKFIKKVKEQVNIPVIVNGDIKCFDTATKALEESTADGVMIGRGCYGKPWLLSQIAEYLETGVKIPDPSLEQQHIIIQRHYNEILDLYGEDNGIKIARKHLGWYSSGLARSGEYRAAINLLSRAEDVRNKITEYYDKISEQSSV